MAKYKYTARFPIPGAIFKKDTSLKYDCWHQVGFIDVKGRLLIPKASLFEAKEIEDYVRKHDLVPKRCQEGIVTFPSVIWG